MPDSFKEIVNELSSGTTLYNFLKRPEIKIADNVDVYDGEDFNFYTNSYVDAATYFGEGYTKSNAKKMNARRRNHGTGP